MNRALWPLALRTKKRLGLWPVLFLSLAVCAFLLGVMTFGRLRAKKQAPYRMETGYIGSGPLDALLAQPKVERISPIYALPETLHLGEKSLSLTLFGQDSGLLEGKLTGNAYPQDSATAYLVLNEAACQALGAEKGQEETLLGKTLSLESGIYAQISGILADEKGSPQGFLSVNCARSLLKPGAECERLAITLDQAGNAPKALRFMAYLGYDTGTENPEENWGRRQEQGFFLLILGFISLLAGLALTAQGETLDAATHKAEYDRLGKLLNLTNPVQSIHSRWHLLLLGQAALLGLLASLLAVYLSR